MTIEQQIISFLQNHPEGIDDDQLAKALSLSARQQANIRCRELEKEGLVIRRPVKGKIHNFWAGNPIQVLEPELEVKPSRFDNWFWEGNVQARTVDYLVAQHYAILSVADTASHQRGIDIVAEREGVHLWVSVKGYPTGTEKTKAIKQAGHWFKQAIFDMIEYRERDKNAMLALALPDFPRYHRLALKISWFKPVAKFSYVWVNKDGEVAME